MSSVCSSSNLDSLFNDESFISFDAASLDSVDLNDVQSTPEMCLIMNQHFQSQLEDFVSLIEDKLEENRQKQHNLNERRRSKLTSTKDNSYLKFVTPYFRDRKGLSPPPNEDTEQKQLNNELNQNYAIPIKKWTSGLEEMLSNSIKEYYLKDRLEQLRTESNSLKYDLEIETCNLTIVNLKEKLELSNQNIDRLMNSVEVNFDDDLVNKIDWLYISKLMDNTYDDLNCKLYWTNYLNPKINKEQWSTEETSKLGILTKNLNHFNWERIAEQLGTNRKGERIDKKRKKNFTNKLSFFFAISMASC